MTTLPDPGEWAAHLAARDLTSMLGLLANSVPAAGDTIQFPAGAATAERKRADDPVLAATPWATRLASIAAASTSTSVPPVFPTGFREVSKKFVYAS